MVEQLDAVVQRQHGQAAEQHAKHHQTVGHLGFGTAAQGQGDPHRLGRFESQEEVERFVTLRNREDEVATELLRIEQRPRQTIADLAEQLLLTIGEEVQIADIGCDDAQQALLGIGLDASVQPERPGTGGAVGLGGSQRLEGGQPVTDVVEREFAGDVLVLRPARIRRILGLHGIGHQQQQQPTDHKAYGDPEPVHESSLRKCGRRV